MSREHKVCFVIMPFSGTQSCTEEEWTHILENVIKPAVEGRGLDYVCRRARATRGNVVREIVNDLYDSYLVLADLTDQNPNVFYELGVRHALKERTILIAQKKEDIPSDLRSYAYHIYEWKTDEGRARLSSNMRELLLDVDQRPDKPDNPVSDFLRWRRRVAAAGLIEGLLEYDMEGNLIFKFDPSRVSAKEAVSLVLYAHHPRTLTSRRIDNLLSRSWRDVGESYVRAVLSQLKGKIRREKTEEGIGYSLSGAGIAWIEQDVLSRLKSPEGLKSGAG